jgi:hypothetical protein
MNEFLRKHWSIIVILGLVYLIGTYLVTTKPLMSEVKSLEKTFPLFGLSMNTTIILLWISAYLLYRWNKTGRKNLTNLIWAVSFALYSTVFIGMMLQALGIPWANAKKPEIFFLFREFQIIWAAGMYFGVSRIFTRSKILQWTPTLLILLFGYVWFYYGLLVVKDIEYMMYGFLYGIWIPVCILLAYLFLLYSKHSNLIAPMYIAIGFTGIAFTYMLWAPWHRVNFYFICFFWYLLSLVPLLVGFLMIPPETEAKGIKE